MSLRIFLFGLEDKAEPVCCHVSLGSGTQEELLEQRQKFLDVKASLTGLLYFDVTNFDAEFYVHESYTTITDRLTEKERKAFDDKPWVELSPERAVDVFKDVEVARTAADFAHIDESGIFWSAEDKYTDEKWETAMILWEEFGVKPERDRAALALENRGALGTRLRHGGRHQRR